MFHGDQWADARREFHDDVIPRLMKVGKAIGAAGQAGDELCNKIMGHYEMLRRSFDPLFFELLKRDFEAYLLREAKRD